jgi:predicted ferric reductase
MPQSAGFVLPAHPCVQRPIAGRRRLPRGVEAIAAHHPSLRVHLRYSQSDGPLTAEDVLRPDTGKTPPSVYTCGPPPMMKALTRGFSSHGVPPANVRWEDFGAR